MPIRCDNRTDRRHALAFGTSAPLILWPSPTYIITTGGGGFPQGTKVKLLGWQTEDGVREQYAAASIFMLPSITASNGDQEGLGLVLLEAQAMGLPVVASRHNGFPEAVIDGETGFLVPERDVTALADKLLYLAQRPSAWPAFGKAGRTNITRSFNIEKLNDRLVNIFQTT